MTLYDLAKGYPSGKRQLTEAEREQRREAARARWDRRTGKIVGGVQGGLLGISRANGIALEAMQGIPPGTAMRWAVPTATAQAIGARATWRAIRAGVTGTPLTGRERLENMGMGATLGVPAFLGAYRRIPHIIDPKYRLPIAAAAGAVGSGAGIMGVGVQDMIANAIARRRFRHAKGQEARGLTKSVYEAALPAGGHKVFRNISRASEARVLNLFGRLRDGQRVAAKTPIHSELLTIGQKRDVIAGFIGRKRNYADRSKFKPDTGKYRLTKPKGA